MHRNASFDKLIERLHKEKIKINQGYISDMDNFKDSYRYYSNRLKQEAWTIEAIEKILTEMLNNNLFPNNFIICQCLKFLSDLNYFNYTKSLYQIAVETKLANSVIYNTMLNAIAKSKDLDEKQAFDIFNKAKSMGLANNVTYNSMLDVIAKSKNPNVKRALSVFNEACQDGFKNEILYNTMLNVIAKSKNPDEKQAIDIFKKAMASGFSDAILYTSMLDVIANSHDPEVTFALDLFNTACRLNIANSVMYGKILNVIANSHIPDVNAARAIFKKAEEQTLVEAITYNNMLHVIARSSNPDVEEALTILKKAVTKNLDSVVTYNNMLEVIANSSHPDLNIALAIYKKIQHKDLATPVTYRYLLNVIAKAKDSSYKNFMIKRIFDGDAFQKHEENLNLLDNILDEAEQKGIYLFKKEPKRFGFSFMKESKLSEEFKCDLHGFSKGAVEILLKRFIYSVVDGSNSYFTDKDLGENKETPICLALIYGKGLHSKQGKCPVKDMVLKIIDEMKEEAQKDQWEWELSGVEDTENTGLFHFQMKYVGMKEDQNLDSRTTLSMR